MTITEIDKLSAEEINARIAALCGWTKCRLVIKGAGGGTRIPTAHGFPPKRNYEAGCPDYFRSMDYIHKAEQTLTDEQQSQYVAHLTSDISEEECDDEFSRDAEFKLATRTAAQRAKAFLAVMG